MSKCSKRKFVNVITQSPSPCWIAFAGTSSPSDPNPLVCRVRIRPKGARDIERAPSYFIQINNYNKNKNKSIPIFL